jgi:transcriptional regulator with XRE-family HTH domain
MTQEALSLETGVHRNYIGGIERGERSPSVTAVVKLADALGVTLTELFTRAERIAAGLA